MTTDHDAPNKADHDAPNSADAAAPNPADAAAPNPADAAASHRADGAPDPAVMRQQYRSTAFLETELAPAPMEQFARWFREAATGGLHEPNAMIVSTATPDGRPSSRTVLLKQYDARGFVFFTNYRSRKGREIDSNPYVSLLFPWHPLARQVIVTGTATRIAWDETVAYFRTRPHGSQLGAWASEQSSVIASREELLRRYEELESRYPEGRQVPAPPEWGGYRVEPESVEFWQGHQNRLHDRLRYVRTGTSGWRVERLAP